MVLILFLIDTDLLKNRLPTIGVTTYTTLFDASWSVSKDIGSIKIRKVRNLNRSKQNIYYRIEKF